jgi:hypothetical protein
MGKMVVGRRDTFRDTFIVQHGIDELHTDSSEWSTPTRIVKMPGGRRVHIMDRAMFDHAVKAAMRESK